MKQRGIGLLELMLALTIIALLLIMATRYFYLVDQSRKVTQATDMVEMIESAGKHWLLVHNDYSKPSGYKTLGDAMIAEAYLPADFSSDSPNPWGGSLEIYSDDGKSFAVAMKRIPIHSCNNLKNKIGGNCSVTKSLATYILVTKISQ